MARREFLQAAALAVGSACAWTRAAGAEPAAPLFSAMGMAAPLERAAALKELGADFLTVSTDALLVPAKPEAEFEQKLGVLKAAPLPVLACNGFIRPAQLHCVGADANHDEVLAWAEIVFRRLQRATGKLVVFGSGSSRALRAGWTKVQADAQFVALLKRMGPLAAAHEVTVVVEQLQASECNYINHLGEGAALIRQAAHPRIRLAADLYHMARMGDTPADLKAAMDVLAHVEIAEKDGRSVPGVHGDDFRPYFRVLRDGGYQGAISIEGKGDDEQIRAAFKEIARQAATA